MGSAAGFVAQFFPLFLLGALFGKLMEDSGSVCAIARWMTVRLGPKRAVMAVVLAGAAVTYGGVSLFVAIFVLATLLLFVVVLVNLAMSIAILPNIDAAFLAEPRWGGTSLAAVAGEWSVAVALASAILPAFLPTAVQAQINALSTGGQLGRMPPVLTFQSVVDATVSTRAALTKLYARLPENGSELVLFDMNRNARVGPLFSQGAASAIANLQPREAQRFRFTLVTNASSDSAEVVERSTPAGSLATAERGLGLAWPREVFSLSHIALPLPPQDGLYGNEPDPADNFGLQLGALAVRGERGVLVTSLDSLTRISANPFFDYLAGRVGEVIRPAQ